MVATQPVLWLSSLLSCEYLPFSPAIFFPSPFSLFKKSPCTWWATLPSPDSRICKLLELFSLFARVGKKANSFLKYKCSVKSIIASRALWRSPWRQCQAFETAAWKKNKKPRHLQNQAGDPHRRESVSLLFSKGKIKYRMLLFSSGVEKHLLASFAKTRCLLSFFCAVFSFYFFASVSLFNSWLFFPSSLTCNNWFSGLFGATKTSLRPVFFPVFFRADFFPFFKFSLAFLLVCFYAGKQARNIICEGLRDSLEGALSANSRKANWQKNTILCFHFRQFQGTTHAWKAELILVKKWRTAMNLNLNLNIKLYAEL